MDYQLYTAVGSREINEDYIGAAEADGCRCFVLCDGLGGHGKGEVASEMISEYLLNAFRAHPGINAAEIAEAFEGAQNTLLAEQSRLHLKNEMKTTAAALYVGREEAVWAHIGDSRLYLFRKNKIVTRTLDHSVPQILVMTGEIKEKQIRQHPDRNRLLRVFGDAWGERKYEISEPVSLKKCQAFLLCSDGFWEYITEKEMCRALKKSSSAQEWMQLMLAEVNKNGQGQEMDNHSAIAVRI